MKTLRQTIVLMTVFIFNLSALALPARAALIGTESLAAAQSRQAAEDKVRSALAREDVASQMGQMGISADDARQRVAALSDEELATLSDRIDRLPAGGDFFGTVGVIFIILVITDILGFTKVFPFTRAQR